jgi:leucyl/phenylalanyl-tRNA--protein transferase
MKRLAWLSPGDPPDRFPPVDGALDEPAGLVAAGGDLSPARLREAYRRGIFPWYSPGDPLLWWSPDPREVLFPERMHVSRSLGKRLRRGGYRVTEDQDFAAVISACASARGPETGTWITTEMQAAYIELHRLGTAHSIEVWSDDELVGGLYGVATGRVFSGESMFSRRDDASKVAMAWLAGHCSERGYSLIDCQMPSAHLRSLGSEPMPRHRYLQYLRTD